MKDNSVFIAFIIFLSCITSCTNHSESDLIDTTPPDPDPEFVTYNTDVKIIIDNNCIFCHSDPAVNGASFPLTTYTNVKSAVENLNLISRISAQAGETGAMPFGGPRLPQNLIDIIIQWETDGLLADN